MDSHQERQVRQNCDDRALIFDSSSVEKCMLDCQLALCSGSVGNYSNCETLLPSHCFLIHIQVLCFNSNGI